LPIGDLHSDVGRPAVELTDTGQWNGVAIQLLGVQSGALQLLKSRFNITKLVFHRAGHF
jgi:hypothetical protein